jgi:hypothetical protein
VDACPPVEAWAAGTAADTAAEKRRYLEMPWTGPEPVASSIKYSGPPTGDTEPNGSAKTGFEALTTGFRNKASPG